MFAGTTDDRKLISNFHLEYTAIAEPHRSEVVHNFIRELDRNLRVIIFIGSGGIYLSAMGNRRTGINVEANKGLCTLTHASLDTIKVIISGVATALLARKNDFKTIRLKLILASSNNLPSQIRLTLSISLRAGISAAMASIKGNYPNVFSSRACSIGRNAVR